MNRRFGKREYELVAVLVEIVPKWRLDKAGDVTKLRIENSRKHNCASLISLFPMVNEIKDSVIIKHAPIGCGTMNMYYHARDGKSRYIRTVNTNLTEADVISGGEEKLVQAIRFAATEFQPQNIFILSSCVPTLMGDDLDAVVTQLQKEVSPTLIPVLLCWF